MAAIISKYIWFLQLIQSKGSISLENLNIEYRNSELETQERLDKGLARKTVYNWREEILSTLGVEIKSRKEGKTWEYYIDYSDEKSRLLREWLISTYTMATQLANNKNISDRILLEEVPSGQLFLSAITNAMQKNNVIQITYKGFGKTQESTFEVEPYFLKLSHRRWYLIANNPYLQNGSSTPVIRIYGLDRVLSIQETDRQFVYPSHFDPHQFFDHYYGSDKYSLYDKPLTIKVKCSQKQSYYWDSLDVHESQEKIEILRSGECIYQLNLYPTYDFIQFLLSQGKEIEILEPLEFRNEIATYIESMMQKYNNK